MSGKKVVTLVGSMRFYDEMLKEGSRLSQEGWLVIHPFKDPNVENLSGEMKEMYDIKIRKSIDMSSAVYVVNVDGYIGKSTESEIEYARLFNKEIMYMNPDPIFVPKPKIITMIGSVKYLPVFKAMEKILVSAGHVVFLPSIFDFSKDELTSELHQVLDQLHRSKMMMSHDILVVNPLNYYGDDTTEEIIYAENHGLYIKYADGPKQDYAYHKVYCMAMEAIRKEEK